MIALGCSPTRSQRAGTETLTVAGGCFWCVEADFESVRGVKGAVSGFAGGKTKTRHTNKSSLAARATMRRCRSPLTQASSAATNLLAMFFRSIDPTDAGGQFCDRGASYRTAIFANGAHKKQPQKKPRQTRKQRLARNRDTSFGRSLVLRSRCLPSGLLQKAVEDCADPLWVRKSGQGLQSLSQALWPRSARQTALGHAAPFAK